MKSLIYKEHGGRVVGVADCEFTHHGFESSLAPLVNYLRAMNKFSYKSTCSGSPSHTGEYQLCWR